MDQNYFWMAEKNAHTHTQIHTEAQQTYENEENRFISAFQGVAFYIIISVLMVDNNVFGLLDLRLGFRSTRIIFCHCVFHNISR